LRGEMKAKRVNTSTESAKARRWTEKGHMRGPKHKGAEEAIVN